MGRKGDAMFSESLLDSGAGRGRRGWSTLLSYAGELIALAIVLTVPLLRSVALPGIPPPRIFFAVRPIEAAQRSTTAARPTAGRVYSTRAVIALQAPHSIPNGIRQSSDPVYAQAPPGPYVPGAVTASDNIISELLSNGPRALPLPTPASRRTGPVKVSSGVSSGFLLHEVRPAYPPIAIATRTQGAVVLAAVIDRNGTIEKLRVVSGHPMLLRAAIDAVSQWRYRPYLLNGEPVEVETQITVNFVLGQ